MLKTGRGEKIGRFHRSDHAAAGFAVDGYSARQHRGSGHVLVQGLRSCQQGCRRRRLLSDNVRTAPFDHGRDAS